MAPRGADIEISHPEKVLFPQARLTKRHLADHYLRLAQVMLPHLRDRPLALHGFPQGVEGKGFYLKNVPDHFPDWIERAKMRKRDGTVTHALAQNAATPVYLAGQNIIALHYWLSRALHPRKPDRMIIDFDPSGGGFADIRAAAREAGDRLRDLGLVPFAMVTGSRGIHVSCPLRPVSGFQDVHRFARALAEEMVADNPRRLTLEWKKADRGDKIFVDVNRNAYAQHAIAPYSARATPRATVAMPIRWDELSDARLRPDRYTIKNAADRVESEGDAWKGMGRRARALPPR